MLKHRNAGAEAIMVLNLVNFSVLGLVTKLDEWEVSCDDLIFF